MFGYIWNFSPLVYNRLYGLFARYIMEMVLEMCLVGPALAAKEYNTQL